MTEGGRGYGKIRVVVMAFRGEEDGAAVLNRVVRVELTEKVTKA